MVDGDLSVRGFDPPSRETLALVPWGGDGPDPLGGLRAPGRDRAALEAERESLDATCRTAGLDPQRCSPGRDGSVKVYDRDRLAPGRQLVRRIDAALFARARQVVGTSNTAAAVVASRSVQARVKRPREHRAQRAGGRRAPPNDGDLPPSSAPFQAALLEALAAIRAGVELDEIRSAA